MPHRAYTLVQEAGWILEGSVIELSGPDIVHLCPPFVNIVQQQLLSWSHHLCLLCDFRNIATEPSLPRIREVETSFCHVVSACCCALWMPSAFGKDQAKINQAPPLQSMCAGAQLSSTLTWVWLASGPSSSCYAGRLAISCHHNKASP